MSEAVEVWVKCLSLQMLIEKGVVIICSIVIHTDWKVLLL